MAEPNSALGASGPRSLSQYYNASQLRADTWNRLKNITAGLANPSGSEDGRQKLHEKAAKAMDTLEPIESYWAYPGRGNFLHLRRLLQQGDHTVLARNVARIVRALMSDSYRHKTIPLVDQPEAEEEHEDDAHDTSEERIHKRPYFEVLIVDNLSIQQEHLLGVGLCQMRRAEDPFVYEPVVVPSFEDALIGVLFNHNIQSVVIRYGFPFHARNKLELLQRYLARVGDQGFEALAPEDYGATLAQVIRRLRPEVDIFLVTDQSVEEVAGRVTGCCRRVFYSQEDYLELHLNILRGVNDRYQTPFFTALREYSKQPTGVFHAMPISRGKSIAKSHWIRDMGDFYGMNIFLAETSATSGGLDSLLDPHGPIKKAQELAARAFGARQTFFATNGTSTCNKIVVQALVQPGDIVLVDRDCHKSHHYGMVLSGAQVIYLDSYPLHQYSMYGAVPLKEIKRQLLALRKAGKLDQVKMLLLTNCTFDGVVYNVERVMEECLAIKPDLVFLWDEAWFGFARFGPTYRQRTAMHAAQVLFDRYRSADYKAHYREEKVRFGDLDNEAQLLETRLLPDPDRVRVRVYATQSTHKTLTALRQGSMIHVFDQDYKAKAEEPFHEAFMTHTSTSPNYQILASLDVGRRQVELEGFEMVQKQVEMAMLLRQTLVKHPLLSKYFKVLRVGDMIPEAYRESGIESYYDEERGWNDIWTAWASDEFCLDATRVTLMVGATGMDGDTFKNDVLMDRYGIQVNKTSRNSVLFMTNIGTTRSSLAYLIEVLVQIAQDFEDRLEDTSPVERRLHEKKVTSLTENLPPLPDFSRFHSAFSKDAGEDPTTAGDIRSAYFRAYNEDEVEYLELGEGDIESAMDGGREVVSANFVIPYPPGFPILVPGQVISREILAFMRALDVKEIHGYRPELGLRVFSEQALANEQQRRHG